MFQNNNTKILSFLARMNLKNNKLRNRFAGIIIILATFLLTVFLVMSYNTMHTMRTQIKYQGIYQKVQPESIEKLNSNPELASIGVGSQVGSGTKDGVNIIVTYSDVTHFELMNMKLVEGELPRATNEIVVPKNYQGGLNIGDSVEIEFRNMMTTEIQSETMIITGLSSLNTGNSDSSFMLTVSKSFLEQDTALYDYGFDVLVTFKGAQNYTADELLNKVDEVADSAGISLADSFANTGYISSNIENLQSTLSVAVVAIIILLACSLVIYNIFYISIIQKVKEYGQLRTIGTTKKQVRKIVYKEGRMLAMIYIPIGTVLGYLAAFFASKYTWNVIMDTLLALLSAVIIFMTVMLSVRKPAVIASEFSPVESAKLSEGKSTKKKSRKASSYLTPKTIGMRNLTRNKKKMVLTFSSLVLTGVLFITMATLLGSLNPETMAKRLYQYDGSYIIKLNGSLLSPSVSETDLQMKNPLSKEIEQALMEVNGVKEIITTKNLDVIVDGFLPENAQAEITSMQPMEFTTFEENIISGNLRLAEESPDNIILNAGSIFSAYAEKELQLGDTVILHFKDGDKSATKEFQIIAIFYDHENTSAFFSTVGTMDSLTEMNSNYNFEVVLDGKANEGIQSEISKIVSGDENLEMSSLADDTAFYRKAMQNVTIIIYAFAGFIALFAVVNLINTIITNIISRKHETGVMQSIGLTSVQLVQSLRLENAVYIFGSFLISAIIGNAIGLLIGTVVHNMPGLSYINYEFPTMLIVIYLVVMIAIQFIVTFMMKKNINKQSVVERLRSN